MKEWRKPELKNLGLEKTSEELQCPYSSEQTTGEGPNLLIDNKPTNPTNCPPEWRNSLGQCTHPSRPNSGGQNWPCPPAPRETSK